MREARISDDLLKQVMCEKAGTIEAAPEDKCRINRRIDMILQRKTGEKKLKQGKVIKYAAAIAAVCIIVPGTVFAAGKVVSYNSSESRTGEDTSFEDMSSLQKKLGYEFKCVENFSNGYFFKSMNTAKVEKKDADADRVGTYMEWDGTYVRENAPDVNIYISKVQAEEDENTQAPQETRQLDGICISYAKDHYKFVPENYKLTQEDLANEKKAHYFISEGTDSVEENEVSSVSWQEEGITYLISVYDTEMSPDDMISMAKEIIESR